MPKEILTHPSDYFLPTPKFSETNSHTLVKGRTGLKKKQKFSEEENKTCKQSKQDSTPTDPDEFSECPDDKNPSDLEKEIHKKTP